MNSWSISEYYYNSAQWVRYLFISKFEYYKSRKRKNDVAAYLSNEDNKASYDIIIADGEI